MDTKLAERRREDLTFRANLRTTRYGWLRLTPAYSVHLVRQLVDESEQASLHVLDPFCGTGTTALVCSERGIASTTTDINPFLVWLAASKSASYTSADLRELIDAANVVRLSICRRDSRAEWVPPIHQIEKWWDEPVLHALARAMASIHEVEGSASRSVGDLLRIAFCRVMIGSAHVSFGHQSMSFRRRSSEPSLFAEDEIAKLAADWDEAVADVARGAAVPIRQSPRVLLCDARRLSEHVPASSVDLVITSPPYPNRMSYIRELRPYMYWLGFLKDGKEAGELDWQAIGGTWGVATSRLNEWSGGDGLAPHSAMLETCQRIGETSVLLARYVAKYFVDMKEHCRELHAAVRPGGRLHYIVGNSKFYDVLLPVERFFAELFTAAGFHQVDVKQIRKRTSKRELFEYCVSASKPH